ncbi:ubiquitin-specific protease otu1 [Podila horticola]|nr:ubiquitin-specific protease otu1 [Podila horticola]
MSLMRLRIRHKDGLATLSSLTPQSTLLELHNAVATEINVPSSQLELKSGYPPKVLSVDDANASQSSLESLGIRDGDQILTSESRRTASAAPATTASTASTASKPAVTSASSSTPANISSFAPVNSGSFGFGSAPVVQSAQSGFQARNTTTGSQFGGLSTVDSSYKAPAPKPVPIPVPTTVPATPVVTQSVEGVRIRDHGFLVVREVEDDNSCLFNAIAYTLDPTMKSNIQGLRQIVALAIEANPDEYPDVVLGRPRKDYCDWIRKENSWGGAIELAIFSEHYNIEIDSIDVSTNRVDRFGEGQYSQRAILMYSGIHYDAVALTPALDIPADCDQTQFEVGLDDIVNGGVQLAAKLKKAHKYTDLATFTLRCSICQIGLKGEKDAQNHAQQTQHTSL